MIKYNIALTYTDAFVYVKDFINDVTFDLLNRSLSSSLLEYSYYTENGCIYKSPRQMCWYAENPDWNYPFSKSHGKGLCAHAFSESPYIESILDELESRLGVRYNSMLLNYYKTGDEYSAWHSDDDPWLDNRFPIASITVGSKREFLVRPKLADHMGVKNFTKSYKDGVRSFTLESGSLLLMNAGTQEYWRHALPPQPGSGERINMTFRMIHPDKVSLQYTDKLKSKWAS